MLFRSVHVLEGRQLPIADPTGSSDPFVCVFQDALAEFQIGATKFIPQNVMNPTWNEHFDCHGIRGLNFRFEIFDYDRDGTHDLMGVAFFDPIHFPLGTDCWLPVVPSRDEAYLPPGWQPAIRVRIEQIPAQPILLQPQGQPIQMNQVIYINLSFSPEYKPKFPIQGYRLGFIPCPLDIGIITFNAKGEVVSSVFNGEVKGKGLTHSGIAFCYCYDTFGPSIRIDVGKLFGNKKKAAFRAVLTVSSNDPNVQLANFRWIAADFYVSQEKMFQVQKKRIMATPQYSTPFFHSRVGVPAQPGSTLTVASILSITPMGALTVQPFAWGAPNQFIPFKPLSCLECTPELAQLCQLNPAKAKRRISTIPGCPASINRAMAIQGFNQIIPICVGLGWKTTTDLDASCIVYGANFAHIDTVSFSKLQAFGGRIKHTGDNRTGEGDGDDEQIIVDLPGLPPQAHFLCFTVTSFQGTPFTKVKKAYIRIQCGKGCEIFRANLTKSENRTSLFFAVIYRAGPYEWNIYPTRLFMKGTRAAQIQPIVQRELQRIFTGL